MLNIDLEVAGRLLADAAETRSRLGAFGHFYPPQQSYHSDDGGDHAAECRVVIYENECRPSWYVCEQVRYVLEPQLRAAWLLPARRARGDARPDDDDAPRRGGERPLDDDAHAQDASVTGPSELPTSSK